MERLSVKADTIPAFPPITTPADRSYTLRSYTLSASISSYAEWRHLQAPIAARRPLTEGEFMEQYYREGKLLNLPLGNPLTEEEEAELERLAQIFADGKPMSEMVIEDRGPY